MKRALLLACLLLPAPAFAGSASPNLLELNVDHGVSLNLSAPASSVFIANPEIADVQVMSPTQVMIFGKRTGETSFMASDGHGHILAQRNVLVMQDLAPLRMELESAIPGNNIKATAVPNGIILTGEAKDASSVADAYKIAQRYLPGGGDIVNRVQVSGSNQVMIRVRFAEVQKNIDNTFGIDLANAVQVGGGMVLGLASGNLVNATGTGMFNQGTDNNTGLFPRPNNTSLNLPNDVAGAHYASKHLSLNGMIDALAQEGLVTILAEPNLTAMSGETANFLAGGEFPIPVPEGNGTISITFKSYGISLMFTPTILNNNRISLHVRPEVSELSDAGSIVLNNITVPGLTTRKAETTVEVGSGESFAIAGLMNNSQTHTIDKFPLLGDMPVLGPLFRSDHFQNGQTELMVVITPYVVTPSNKQLALPTDGFRAPTESERLLKERTSSRDPDLRPMSGEPSAVLATPPLPAVVTPVVPATVTAMPPVAIAPADAAPVSNLQVRQPEPVAPEPVPAVVAEPVAIVPQDNSPPITLHSSQDADTNNGGLLVE